MNLRDILNILDDFNDTVPSWRRILDKIDDAVQDYNAAIADDEEDPAANLREWLPQYWQAVRAININQWERREERLPIDVPYDVGIFLVGFSSIPIVLSIAEIQPRQEIYFIHSNDTRRKCDEITNRFTEMLKEPPPPFSELISTADATSLMARVRCADRREIAKPSDPVSTFQEIKDIIDSVRERLGNDARIALDLTGGKKTMIGGGFTAGSIYSISPQCDMFYVDSLVYNPDRGAPKPGTEFLSRLDNPYNVYNVQSVGQAKELFKQHNYEGAAVLWDDVRKKLDDPAGQLQSSAERYGLTAEQDIVEKNLGMANCYGFWDAFDYKEAKASKNTDVSDGYDWGYDKHVHNGINVLDILSEVDNLQDHFGNDQIVIHYAVDRYQNGIRRMESDRYEDAIVRFTQVAEILSKYKLYQIAQNGGLLFLDQKVQTGGWQCMYRITRWDTWNLTPLICFLFGDQDQRTYESYPYSYQIPDPTNLLNLDAYSYNQIKDITNLIRPRNQFIHVSRTPALNTVVDNAKNLQELALEFLEDFSDQYCKRKKLSFQDLLQLHEFRQL